MLYKKPWWRRKASLGTKIWFCTLNIWTGAENLAVTNKIVGFLVARTEMDLSHFRHASDTTLFEVLKFHPDITDCYGCFLNQGRSTMQHFRYKKEDPTLLVFLVAVSTRRIQNEICFFA